MEKVQNATITRADIYVSQPAPDVLTHVFELDFQCAGGGHRETPRLSPVLIGRVMQVAGVRAWADVAGCLVRIKCTEERVLALGNLVEEEWVDLSPEVKDA